MLNSFEANSIPKPYNNRSLLNGIYLKRDNIIGISRRNTSGKPTLLKIKFGYVKADF